MTDIIDNLEAAAKRLRAYGKPAMQPVELAALLEDAALVIYAARPANPLWAVYVKGPDEFHAMSSLAGAEQTAEFINRNHDEVRAVVVHWNGTAEEHAAETRGCA